MYTAITGNNTETNLHITVYSTIEAVLHGQKGSYLSIICYNFLLANKEIHGTVSMHRQTEQCLVILYPDFYSKKGRKKLYDEYSFNRICRF
jgi:hypothetical protein